MSELSWELRPFDALCPRRLYALCHLRELVFVYGQRITAEVEVDGLDMRAAHLLVWGAEPSPVTPEAGRDAPCPPDASRAALRHPEESERFLVACARVFLDEAPALVGRIAVHPSLQGRGVGRRLMGFVHEALGPRRAAMHAQQHLEGWYASLGWERRGEVFMEAEIPHVTMVRAAARDEVTR